MTEAKIHYELAQIIRYEAGKMTDVEVVALFAEFIRTGIVWQLQGHYGAQARALHDAGIIDTDGNIDQEAFDDALDS